MKLGLDSLDEDTREEIQRRIKEKMRERNRELHYQKALIERVERESRKRRIQLLALLLPLVSLMISFSIVLLEDGGYSDKKELQEDFIKIISNGGDLPAIKQAFNMRPTASRVKLLFAKSSTYEPKIPLSTVLNDLRVNAYRNGETNLIASIDKIICIHEEVNPFDKLPSGQKDYFENIRIKTGDDYAKISNDVNNLADELHQQNSLVSEYLSDSKLSFWISIFAVILAAILGGYQIFMARPAAMRKLFLTALDGKLSDSNSDDNEYDSNNKAIE